MISTSSSNDFATKVGLLGSGNMAWQIGPSLQQAGIPVVAVCSRTKLHAQKLAHRLGCPSYTDWGALKKLDVDIWICCLADSALETVLPQLKIHPKSLLAHTSGSQPLSVLSKYQKRTGVFYPLQTMTRGKRIDFMQVPIFLEGSTEADVLELQSLAIKLTPRVHRANSEERRKLHLASIFACNFTNHLWAIASDLLNEQGYDLSVLSHLIHETTEKALMMAPEDAQTGPAVRGDQNVMDQHLKALSNNQEYQEVYEKLSESIQKTAGIGKQKTEV